MGKWSFTAQDIMDRAIYTVWDMQQANSALAILQEDREFGKSYKKKDMRRFQCYETQAIVAFCRPLAAKAFPEIGHVFDDEDLCLKEKVFYLRNKKFAHSDQEEMHFKSRWINVSIEDEEPCFFPTFVYDEALDLTEKECDRLMGLCGSIISSCYEYIFRESRRDPSLIKHYKFPDSWKDDPRFSGFVENPDNKK
ncbi:hypothetical protein EQG41_20610 [Billgrantia azerbaijanica]|nr:hypothetical protein EQG41_20610 [Halomonas azerbaijanica]